jgi:penicillin-binding protein A
MLNIFSKLSIYKCTVRSPLKAFLVILVVLTPCFSHADRKQNGHSVSYKKVYLEGNKPSSHAERVESSKKAGPAASSYTTRSKQKKAHNHRTSHSPSEQQEIPARMLQDIETESAFYNDTANAVSSVVSEELVAESIEAVPDQGTAMARLSSSSQVLSSGAYQHLDHVGPFLNREGDSYYEIGPEGDKMYLTLNPRLQEFATDLLAKNKVPWGAIVAIEPATGRVRALAGHSEVRSSMGQGLVSQSTFPAASLFKIITAAAAVETSGATADTNVNYRGGTYTLNKYNYLPDPRTDKVQMKLGTALGKSCNPAFARVALNNLSVEILTTYASNFGFTKNLAADFPVTPSTLTLKKDKYEFARTAAGFGSAYISPVHAASIAAALGNKGLMMRPYIVDTIVDRTGLVKVHKGVNVLDQVVLESTAEEVLRMMESTTTEGTGVKQFKVASPQLKKISIASKTGTLSGDNPKGRYYWFVAVAPVDNPTLAIASLVIDNGSARINGVGLGRLFYEYYFQTESLITTNQRSPQLDQISPDTVEADSSPETVAANDIPSSST